VGEAIFNIKTFRNVNAPNIFPGLISVQSALSDEIFCITALHFAVLLCNHLKINYQAFINISVKQRWYIIK